jgi:hypothetical protein
VIKLFSKHGRRGDAMRAIALTLGVPAFAATTPFFGPAALSA